MANDDIALEPEEAKRLAKSFAKMQAHYGMQASAKVTDTIAFAMVCVSIYGPRALPMIRRVTEKKDKPSKPTLVKDAE